MGLFNRNKGDAPAPSTPEAGSAPVDSTFDFDAISRDLDAQNGASSFDSLLAAPATNAQTTPTGDSAFDFPENDPLGLSAPATLDVTAPLTGNVPIAASPEAVINAPLNSSVSPATGLNPINVNPVVVPEAPSNVPRAKKPIPLIPLLGALGLLAVAGGGAMFLLNSNQESEAPATVPPPAMGRPPAPQTAVAPRAPVVPGAGALPASSVRSASPGIAPPVAPKQAMPAPGKSSNVPVITGQRPVAALPAVTANLDPQLASKLKALWQAGADAKHHKDYKAARAAWGEALRLRPGHPGFQDSINKLPR